MDIIEKLRYRLHIAINEQNQEKTLKISIKLDQEIAKYLKVKSAVMTSMN